MQILGSVFGLFGTGQLQWLLGVSPVTLPIPGATRAHLEDNLAAAALRLDQDEIQAITAAVSQP